MDMIATVKQHWWRGSTILLALSYLALGVAIDGGTGAAAIVGVIVMGSSLAVMTRSRVKAVALLVVGSLPVAAMTWWSAITPVLVLICGCIAIATVRRTASVGNYRNDGYTWASQRRPASRGPGQRREDKGRSQQ
jgi:hypothetical protein